MRNRKEGFTLIELLIVIAIIGILAAVLIPNLLDARRRAFDTGTQSCLKELATAQEIYLLDDPTDNYAGDFATLVANIEGGAPAACDNMGTGPDVTATAGTSYIITATHQNSTNGFQVTNTDGVTPQ